MAAIAPQVGFDHYTYYNSATHASPTWVLLGQIGDEAIDIVRTLTQLLLRESRWEANLTASIGVNVSFALRYNPGLTAYDTLQTLALAANTTSVKEFFFANGLAATAGSTGLRAGMVIENFPIKKPLNGVTMIDQVTLRLGYLFESSARVEPDMYTVSA